MMKPTEKDAVEQPDELPENMLWITETEGISLEEGVKNAGGISSFIFSLKLFLETIDDNSSVIEKAYQEAMKENLIPPLDEAAEPEESADTTSTSE